MSLANKKILMPMIIPRDYQRESFQALQDGCKRLFLVWHRRSGKDINCLNMLYTQALQRVGVYWYAFPTYKQAKKAIWNGITNDGQKIIDIIHPEVRAEVNKTEMLIRLKNGSIIQFLGINNSDDLAGSNPIGCVMSEWSLSPPQFWRTILSPILRINGGWAVFNGTPRGHNHFKDMYDLAKSDERWFTQKLTIADTNIITDADLDEERALGISEDILQQEYYCSFDRGIEGSYYGRLLNVAEQEDRITNVPYDPAVPVHTNWDIGIGDATAIIFWQIVGKEIHIIDYYENQGEGLAHYVKVLQDKPYIYGTHYGPHDIEARNLSTGMSLKSFAAKLGLKFKVVKRTQIEVGIEAARSIFGFCWFDQKKTSSLVRCLENYTKEWSEKRMVYTDRPLHSWASHGSDAFRYLALSYKSLMTGLVIDDNEAERLYRTYGEAI